MAGTKLTAAALTDARSGLAWFSATTTENQMSPQEPFQQPARDRDEATRFATGRATTGNATLFNPIERVVVDCDLLHLELGRHLDQGDDAAIWRCHHSARSREDCEDWLASLAGTVTRTRVHHKDKSRTTPWHSTLIAAPVIMPGNPDGQAGSAGESLGSTLHEPWQRWVGWDQEVALFTEPLAYSQICCWSPVTQRECLARLMREESSSTAPHVQQMGRSPKGLPQLHLMVGSLRRWLTYPLLPDPLATGEEPWRLRQRMQAQIAYWAGCHPHELETALPNTFAQALHEGLTMLVDTLVRHALVCGWQLEARGMDIVLLELILDGGEQIVLPLRGHQLGPAAIEQLSMHLNTLIGPPTRAKYTSN
jgi:hypothetical protein